jgi:hypothetical protein
MYPEEGLFSEADNYVHPTSYYSRIFVKGSNIDLLKTYFNLVRSSYVNAGDSYYWRGKYSWFDINEFELLAPMEINVIVGDEANVIKYSNVVRATNYNIYRSEEPYGNFEKIGNTSLLYFSDNFANTHSMYFYKVTAVY